MKFQELSLAAPLQKALARMQYETLTPIQESVIPRLLQGESLIAQSITGSGKTLAYALPILQHITFDSLYPQALILVPTRELAQQVTQTLDALGLFLHTHHQMLVGKQSFAFQREDMKQRTHVLVATPGRLLQHIHEGTVHLECLSMLVLDEADEMFRLGFRSTLDKILAQLPAGLQCACFSATFPSTIRRYLSERFPFAQFLEQQEQELPTQLTQRFFSCAPADAPQLLLAVLQAWPIRRCILFVNTIEQAEQLTQFLSERSLAVEALHGKQRQEERFASLRHFRDGTTRILVASNVAARGLDIPEVSLIVNYDFPLTLETYIHRVGRTARMEAAGLAISFVDPSNMTVFEQLQHMDPSVTIDSPVLSVRYPLKELQQPLVRTVRREELVRQDVLRLCIFAGKSKKLRPGDLVGAICSIDGVDGEDIGVIKIQEHHSYVEILNGKGTTVLSALQQRTIKNRRIRVEIAHDSE